MVLSKALVYGKYLIVLTTALLLAACSGGGSDDDTPPPVYTSLEIQLLSTDGSIVQQVTATRDGSVVATSDSNGQVNLSQLPVDQVLALKFSKSGYANQSLRFQTGEANSQARATVTMIPRQAATQFDAADELVLVGEHGATVNLSGNDFVTASGEAVSGTIELSMTPVDVSTSSGLQAFPGSFSARDESDVQVPVIVTYGTTEFSFSQDGEQLQLANGKSVSIELPMYIDKHPDGSDVQLGDTIALWYLDEDTGIWQQQGEGVVVTSAASTTGFALRGEVSHFTWWNVDVAPPQTNVRFLVTTSEPVNDLSDIEVRAHASANGFFSNNILVPLNQLSGVVPVPANTNICFLATLSGMAADESQHTFSSPENCVDIIAGQTTTVELEVDTSAPFTISADVVPTATAGASIASCGTPSRLIANNYAGQLNFAIESGSLPEGLTLNARTGYISGTPSANAVGNSGLISVIATDGLGRQASTSFSIEVSQALSLTATDPDLLGINQPLTLSGLLSASGGLGPYNYQVSGFGVLPEGLVLNGTTGDINGTVLPRSINGSAPALFSVSSIIRLRDQNCAVASQSMTFNFQQPPIIGGTVPATAQTDTLFEYALGNTGGVVEQWSLGNNPSWLSITAEGVLTGTPAPADIGSYSAIEVQATNTIGHASFPQAVDVFTFDIEVLGGTGGEQSISFADPGPISRSINAAPFTNIASGGAGTGAISYASSNPDIATVDANTGEVQVVASGEVSITATKAADATFGEATASYTLIVENTAPLMAGFSEIVFTVARDPAQYSFTPDLLSGENVTWSLSGNVPSWLSANAGTGVISTSLIDQTLAGSYTGITLTASNSLGSAQITPITVVIAPDSAPSISTAVSNGIFKVNAHDSTSIVFGNSGGIATSWTLSGDYPDAGSGWLQLNFYDVEFDPELSIFPGVDHLGTHQLTVRAENSLGVSELTFDLEVSLQLPTIRLFIKQGELRVDWSDIGASAVPVSFNLLVSEQADVTLDNFNDTVADLISNYQAGGAISSVNGNPIDVGNTYYITLQALYAGLETRSALMSPTVSALQDTGMQWCQNGTGVSINNCADSLYPDQDGDFGQDAVNRIGSRLRYQVESFSLLDAQQAITTNLTSAECVRDNISGLIWEYTLEQTPVTSATLDGYISGVNSAAPCGISSWRLPTSNELLSIVNYNGLNRLTFSPFRLVCNNGVPPKRYFTGDRATAALTESWFVDVSSGWLGQLSTDSFNNCAVLVAGNVTIPGFAQRYTDNADGTVTDSHTGLTWKKCAEGYLHNTGDNSCSLNDALDSNLFGWQNALSRAQEVNAGQAQRQNHGHTDWRVPNVKELNSLLRREDHAANMFDVVMFPNTGTTQYWSSTPRRTPAGQAWSTGMLDTGSLFMSARVIAQPLTDTNSLRLVRGQTGKPVPRWYLDQDGDGTVNPDVFVDALSRPPGNYVSVLEFPTYDCNDDDPDISPWVSEVPDDGIDNNCDGVIDEGQNALGF